VKKEISEHPMARLSLPDLRLAPVAVVFIKCLELLFFLCLIFR